MIYINMFTDIKHLRKTHTCGTLTNGQIKVEATVISGGYAIQAATGVLIEIGNYTLTSGGGSYTAGNTVGTFIISGMVTKMQQFIH